MVLFLLCSLSTSRVTSDSSLNPLETKINLMTDLRAHVQRQAEIKKIWSAFRKNRVPDISTKNEQLLGISELVGVFNDIVSAYVGSLINAGHFPTQERMELRQAFEESLTDLKTAFSEIEGFKPADAKEKKAHESLKVYMKDAVDTAEEFSNIG